MSVFVVDGDNLLTIGFYGLKNYFHKGQHIGGLYHFINTLKRNIETHSLDKVVVFWDGEDGQNSRKRIYPHYKESRKKKVKSEEEISSYRYQRNRIKQYLEELYVRQAEFPGCETDDAIAYYVVNSPKENKLIFSGDADLTQLVSDNTKLYNPSHQRIYQPGDTFVYHHQEVLIENVKLVKILCGDPSDDIAGIRMLGIKKLLDYVPEMKTRPLTLDEVRNRFNVLFEENRTNRENKTVTNVLTGVTKHGVLGEEFFVINNQLVNLSEPLLTDEAREHIHALVTEPLDPEGRSYKNTMKMMLEDGIFQLLPKSDDAWIKFLNPFLRLTRKEKNKKIIKIRKYE